jgi:ankyrin repeat protein
MHKANASKSSEPGRAEKSAEPVKSLSDQLIYEIRQCDRIDPIIELLAKGADVNYSNALGWTPLMYAARNSRIEIAKLLIDLGAEVNAKDGKGNNALVYAVWRNNLGMAVLLLDNGADMTVRDRQAADLIGHAKTWGNLEMADLLAKRIKDAIQPLGRGKEALKVLRRSIELHGASPGG